MNESVVLIGPMAFSYEQIKKHVDSKFIIVDGGLNHFSNLNIKDYYSIGDNDSNNTNLILDRIVSPEKDLSDLRLALNTIQTNNPSTSKVYMYGFLGGRKDHELANFGEVNDFLKMNPKIEYVNFESKIEVINSGEHILNIKGDFSILSLTKQKIKITGEAKYKLIEETEILPLSSLGISNNGSGPISFSAPEPLFIFYY